MKSLTRMQGLLRNILVLVLLCDAAPKMIIGEARAEEDFNLDSFDEIYAEVKDYVTEKLGGTAAATPVVVIAAAVGGGTLTYVVATALAVSNPVGLAVVGGAVAAGFALSELAPAADNLDSQTYVADRDAQQVRPFASNDLPASYSGVFNGTTFYTGTRSGSDLNGTYTGPASGAYGGAINRDLNVWGNYADNGPGFASGTFSGQATPMLDQVIGSVHCTANCGP